LGGRRFDTVLKNRDQPVSRVADFPDVQVVELRIGLGAARNGGATENRQLAARLGAALDTANLR
jgi:hypothetical protein